MQLFLKLTFLMLLDENIQVRRGFVLTLLLTKAVPAFTAETMLARIIF